MRRTKQRIFFYAFISFSLFSFNYQILSQTQNDKIALNISLFFSQTINDDWKMGKYESFEISSNNDFNLKLSFANNFNFESKNKISIGCKYETYGNNPQNDILPTDNLIQSENTLKYLLGWKIDPYFNFGLNTQVTESFRKFQNDKIATAKFRDPATTQEGFGFALSFLNNQTNTFEINIGFTTKQTRAEFYTLLTDDKKTKEIERYKAEIGLQLKVETNYKISDAINYKAKFDATLNMHNGNQLQANNDNELKIQIWKIFGILIKIELNYNEQISRKLQYKQSTKFGIITSF
jgi:ribosome-associated translation inhibitor RaiA